MLLRRLTASAISLVPSLILATSASACFVGAGQNSDSLTDNHAALSNLGDVLQQSMVEFPLTDTLGNDVSVGRMVYGVSRNQFGSLDFFYQFFNYSPDEIGLNNVSLDGFKGVTAEVHTLAEPDENIPYAANRSLDSSKIDFLFDDCLLTPGQRTVTLVVSTDAQHYEETGVVNLAPFVSPQSTGSFIDLADAQVQAFAPASSHAAVVPLPAPAWSSLAGLIATIIYVVRHK